MTTLELERREGVAIVTLQREARRNAISGDMLTEFVALRGELEGDPTLRAIVITGAGNAAFCAGADLKERLGMSHDDVRALILRYREAFAWLDASPVPVIAAINGVALGGGLELALLCDLRIAAPTAQLGLPETGLGIIPGAGGTQRLPRVIGVPRAKEMILLGRRVNAVEALEWGLVHRLSNTVESLLDDTLAWIEPILLGAPIAQAAALEAIDSSQFLPLAAGLEREAALYDRCLVSEDRVEALRAFAERRQPVFQGI
jgi:methylglutaconyl-CoA hydratase